MTDLNPLAREWRDRIESVLDHWLPAEAIEPTRLHTAMRYATLGGGKRIRPLLVYATGRVLEIESRALDSTAAAIELIHAYSLIHDDLPAMDNDDLRRGRPTCHRAFDEPTAILAGDALQALAFHVLVEDSKLGGLPENHLAMINILANAAGSRGMVGGQAIDLGAVGKTLTLAELENMHIHKTGMLIHASVAMATYIHPRIDQHIRDRLDHYSKCIGLAFQIHDDILDIESDTETLGKTRGADQLNNKPTFPELLGLGAAKEHAHNLYDEARVSGR